MKKRAKIFARQSYGSYACTALLRKEIYLPTKFLVDTSFRVMSQTNVRTGGQWTEYLLSLQEDLKPDNDMFPNFV